MFQNCWEIRWLSGISGQPWIGITSSCVIMEYQGLVVSTDYLLRWAWMFGSWKCQLFLTFLLSKLQRSILVLLERLTPMTWWPFSHGPSIRFNVFYIPFGLLSKDVQTPLGVRINCEDKLGMGADTLKARNHLSPGAAPKSGPPCGFMVRYTCQGNLKSFSHALFGL